MQSDPLLPQWQGTFAVLEANRRLSSSLLPETLHTSRLTRWIVGLTVAVAVLTMLLASVGGIDPPQDWRTLDDAAHAGIYAPGTSEEELVGLPAPERPNTAAASDKAIRG